MAKQGVWYSYIPNPENQLLNYHIFERRDVYTENSKTEIKFKNKITQMDLEMLARCLLPAIQNFFETDEGKREFEEWKFNQEKK